MSRRISSLMVCGLLIGCFLVLGLNPNAAHAYTTPHTAAVGWNSALSDTLAITVATGDLLVVNIQIDDGSGAGHTEVHVTSVTDTQLNNFSLAKQVQRNFPTNCSTGNCYDDEIWYAVPNSSGSDTVEVQVSQSTISANFEMVDVNGQIGNTVIGNSSGIGTGTSVYTTSGTVAIPVGAFADASVFDSCRGAGVFSSGSHYIALPGSAATVGDSEYGDPSSTPVSPTNFASSCTITSNWIDVGVVFGVPPTPPPPVVVVIACNFFQLQCWAYPLMFLGMYLGFAVGIGSAFNVSEKGFMYLIISLATFGSLICISLGIMTPMLPILLIAANIVYSTQLGGKVYSAATTVVREYQQRRASK